MSNPSRRHLISRQNADVSRRPRTGLEGTIRCRICCKRPANSEIRCNCCLTLMQKEFMPSSTSMSPGDRRGSINSNVPSSMPATSYSTGSSSSGLSSPRLPTTLPPSKRAKVRLVLLLTGQPPRFLTINRKLMDPPSILDSSSRRSYDRC